MCSVNNALGHCYSPADKNVNASIIKIINWALHMQFMLKHLKWPWLSFNLQLSSTVANSKKHNSKKVVGSILRMEKMFKSYSTP